MKQLAWLNKMDQLLKKSLQFFVGALVLVLFVAIPWEKKVEAKRVQLGRQQLETQKMMQWNESLSKREDLKTGSTDSLVWILEDEAIKLNLQDKIVRVTPYSNIVDIEMNGVELEEVMTLLTRIEKNRAACRVISMKLTPETDQASRFYLHAKLQKN